MSYFLSYLYLLLLFRINKFTLIRIYFNEMAFFNFKKSLCLGILLSFCSLLHANSTHNIYMMTLSILSYVKWDNSAPKLCIIDNPAASELFNKTFTQQQTRFQVSAIQAQDLSSKKCDAVFFSQTTPLMEQKLIASSINRSLLSFSKSNYECEIGSIFCLYSAKTGNTQFKVNLDSLAKAKIHIDPRVLLLAQSSE